MSRSGRQDTALAEGLEELARDAVGLAFVVGVVELAVEGGQPRDLVERGVGGRQRVPVGEEEERVAAERVGLEVPGLAGEGEIGARERDEGTGVRREVVAHVAAVFEADFFDMAWAYFQRAHADQVRHAELFFDPQTHTTRGVPVGTVIAGLRRACERAQAELGISSALILCFLRHLSEEAAFATLEDALPYREHFIGVGLDSSEVGHPPSKFSRVFARCRELGLRIVAHAGEEGPPAYIWEALDDLKVERIDHGVRCLEDPALVAELARRRVPLTVCPLSNLKLCVVKDLRDHPMRRLLDAGLCATVNSDDPAYFGGYLNANFEQTVQALGLSREQVIALARNSVEASFVSEARRAELLAELAAVAAA